MKGEAPRFAHFRTDPVAIYEHNNGSLWWMVGLNRLPSVCMQRTDCKVPPLHMPRLELVVGSPWADEWALLDPADPRAIRGRKEAGFI